MSTPFKQIETAELEWKENLPFSKQFQDIYFSQSNGLEESRYVFIDGNQLLSRWQNMPTNDASFVIGETGFGSGLNFLLTWSLWKQFAPPNATLHFFSCEKYPLSRKDLIKVLSLWPELSSFSQALIEKYPVLTPGFHNIFFDNGKVKLTLMLGDAIDCYRQMLHCGDSQLENKISTSAVDAWFLDGFAPAKNQTMWSEELLNIISLLSRYGSTIATFSSSRIVKDNLKKHGFIIEKRKDTLENGK